MAASSLICRLSARCRDPGHHRFLLLVGLLALGAWALWKLFRALWGLLPGVHPASAISRHWIGGQRSPNHQSLEESAVAAVNASTEAFLAHDDQRSYPRRVFDLSVVFNYVALTAGEGRLLSLFHEVE